MLKLFLLICGIFGGTLAEEKLLNCDPGKCKSHLPNLDPTDIDDVLPTKDRLMAMCPDIQLWTTCLNDEISACLNADLRSLLRSENETVAKAANIFVGATGLFNDLCNPISRIHKAYAENIECMRTVVTDPIVGLLCTFEAKSLYGAYKSVNDIEEEAKPIECMTIAHVLACISAEMQEKCGENARVTLLEMVKRTKMLKYGLCTPRELEALKSTYLEFLELEGYRHYYFSEAFDLRKKK